MNDDTLNTRGLSQKEAERRQCLYGPNSAVYQRERSAFTEFLLKFKNPLVFVLLFASAVSAFLGEWVSSMVIIIMVLLSTVLDFANTYKSQKAVHALIDKVRITASVIRDGKIQEIPVTQVVTGDLVSIAPGDIIPADGEVIFSKGLFIDESALTGEAYPAEKQKGDRIFMGGSIIAGEALALIKTIGADTEFNKIAATLARKEESSDFDRGIKDISFLIVRIIFVLVISVFLINSLFNNHGAFQSFLFAVALAVGLTPELLPMVVTINLAKGSLAMSRKGVVVKKLAAIQSFGSMDVFCSDKTGTLTENKIVLVKYVDIFGNESERVLRYACINSFFQGGFKSPLDKALHEFKKINAEEFRKIDEIPFDSTRRMDSVAVESGGVYTLISKGTPEEIFEISAFCQEKGEKFGGEIKARAEEIYKKLSQDGFRVLGVAIKTFNWTQKIYAKEDERDMVFLGFVAFLDPPKKTVSETLKIMSDYNIETKIITGDNDLVTLNIARAINLPVMGVLSGRQTEQMGNEELARVVEKTTIFARMSPEQKVRIIKALQSNGHVVGYLGDGINDAPAIRASDVGISVDNAVDVSKESADFVLLKKSLRDLVEGVIEGRKTFVNTVKYLMMALSSNFGNMLSMAGASFFLPFLPMLPQQILLNNLLYDSSQFTISVDRVDAEDIKKPRRWRIDFIKKYMIVFGLISSAFDIFTFGLLFYVFRLDAAGFQTGWFLASFASQALVVHVLRTRKIPFLQSRPAKILLASTFAAVFISWLIVFTGMGNAFQFSMPSLAESFALIAIVLIYLFVMEFAKRKFYRQAG